MRDTAIPSVAIVLTTLGKDDDARTIATVLVEERLAACVNIIPRVISVYAWEGRLSEDEEQQLLIKTSVEQLAALETRLFELHSYTTPEFMVLKVSGGSEAYLDWVLNSVS